MIYQAPTCLRLVFPAAGRTSLFLSAHRYSVTMPVQTTDRRSCSITQHPETWQFGRDGCGKWWCCIELGEHFKTPLLNCPEGQLFCNITVTLTVISIISGILLNQLQLKLSLSLCVATKMSVTSSLTQPFPCSCYGSMLRIHILLQEFLPNPLPFHGKNTCRNLDI